MVTRLDRIISVWMVLISLWIVRSEGEEEKEEEEEEKNKQASNRFVRYTIQFRLEKQLNLIHFEQSLTFSE